MELEAIFKILGNSIQFDTNKNLCDALSHFRKRFKILFLFSAQFFTFVQTHFFFVSI